MGAGCQYRSRATSSSTHDYYYVPCSRPKTSEGNAPPFSMPLPRFPLRADMTYRCEPTPPPDPAAHWQRASSQNHLPPSSPTRVREDCGFKPVHKQSIEEWVEEQIHLMDRSNLNQERRVRPTMGIGMGMGKEELRQRMRDELVYEYEAEAHKWMNREAEMRRRAQEEVRRRVVQEDIRRIQVRVRQRRDSEREAIAEERKRSMERVQEKARREQARVERAVREAWQAYESRWAALAAPSSSGTLVFRDIPWPTLAGPSRAEELMPDHVTEFLLHPAHSPNHSRRDRIRAALLRWHPDRFQRILNRVIESERDEVDECVGLIARCLNGLLAREGKMLQQVG